MTETLDAQLNRRELYLIVQKISKPFLEDSSAMTELNRINLENPIEAVLIVSERNYPLIRKYCSDRRNPITIHSYDSLVEMTQQIMEGNARNYKRIVAVSDRRTADLRQRKEALESMGIATTLIHLE